MTPDDLPVVSWLSDIGADDQVFDSLLVLGPVVILCIALIGERVELVARAIALLYVGVFVVYVAYQGITETVL